MTYVPRIDAGRLNLPPLYEFPPSATAWYVFSFGLSIYVDYFNGFSMYGSLTTIALIMLWLYFCMYIMMMTVEFNVFLEAYRNGSLNLET